PEILARTALAAVAGGTGAVGAGSGGGGGIKGWSPRPPPPVPAGSGRPAPHHGDRAPGPAEPPRPAQCERMRTQDDLPRYSRGRAGGLAEVFDEPAPCLPGGPGL